MTMKYVAIFEEAEDGTFDVYVPDLPGCVSYGESREEAQRNIEEAVNAHLQLMRESGEPIPEPGNTTGYVEAA